MKSPRQLVCDALLRVWGEGGYSNLILNQTLKKGGLPPEQNGFVAALFYGVLETAPRLDWILERYLKKPRLDLEIRVILRMGLYQLLYMDAVPDRAAVDESVRLAAYVRKTSAKGLINGVLRSFLREGKTIFWPPEEGDPLTMLSVRCACPQWLLAQWTEQFGLETARQLAEASLGRPPLTIRVNTLKTSSQELSARLQQEGVSVRSHPWLEDCLFLTDTGGIEGLASFQEGLFHVQDLSSQLCVKMLDPKPGETLLDICAAPGSKSFTAAERMNNQGRLCAFDLYEKKVEEIRRSAGRLGISILTAQVQDGRCFSEKVPPANRVICDVPCSGLGVVRRKPEIKYKDPAFLEDLPRLQGDILANAARYVKPGGRLLYSTCTTNRRENEEVVREFLAQNFSFRSLQLSAIFSKIDRIGQKDSVGVTLLPHLSGGDGFYLALLERV